jgi:hypothetical protein
LGQEFYGAAAPTRVPLSGFNLKIPEFLPEVTANGNEEFCLKNGHADWNAVCCRVKVEFLLPIRQFRWTSTDNPSGESRLSNI